MVEKSDKILEALYSRRRLLRTKTDKTSEQELQKVEQELSDKYAEKMFSKIKEEVNGIENSEDGGFNSGKLWKLKKKLSPKHNDPPTAMYNSDGTLLTAEEDILKEAEKTL